ncbi:MAG: hypothetical protein IKE45_06655 [Halomonas sp.]|nr:hypothetical protein [Halomonas sp.]MBR2513690.1 hypothetical protein [Halomonas sp.]
MSLTPDILTASPRRQRRHGLARWWLAGLLVSCLLPASLHSADAFRGSERSVSICFWVPAILRAQSKWIAKKRRALRYWASTLTRQLTRLPARTRLLPVVKRRLVAAKDVLTQRGPPALFFLR